MNFVKFDMFPDQQRDRRLKLRYHINDSYTLEKVEEAVFKIEKYLYEKIKKYYEIAGYSSPEEFVSHLLEKEINRFEGADDDPDVLERFKGLGYISWWALF